MAADDPKLSLQQELERTRGLERDLLTELLTSRRAAWRVAVGSFVIAILSAGALASIFPFQKPPLPYVVRVNDATGEIEHVTQLGNRHRGGQHAFHWPLHILPQGGERLFAEAGEDRRCYALAPG